MQSIQEVMTPNPVTFSAAAPITDAARAMRDSGVGDVLVERDGVVCGIVTDRDIVVQVVAEDCDLNLVSLGDICTGTLVALSPTDSVEDAVRLMRTEALRRLPVCDDGHPVGIVSLGDLAVERDPGSVLADISAARPTS